MRWPRNSVASIVLPLLIGLGACKGSSPGQVGEGGSVGAGGSGGGGSERTEARTGIEPLPGPPTRSAGARRLTRDELARSLKRLLGADVPVDTSILPSERLTPFDNDVVEQSPSMLLVESMET